MSSSNTSLNGYEFGRSPRTQTPFWGESGEGAQIDDDGIYTNKTWSSHKINEELSEKADASDLADYAKVTSVYTKAQTYTKEEVDELLSHIEPTVDAYTKAQTDALLADKADVTSVYTKGQTYTKTEVDNLLAQIPAVDAYTKTETDTLLDAKANVSSVYTKSETDSLLANKAGVNSVYTKGQTDRLLEDKANAANVYTKTETDDLIHGKVDRSELDDYAKVTSVYTKAQTYTKTEVDDLISGATPAPVDAYTKAQTDSLLATKADVSDLANYAKATSVYTKTQTYTKAEVDALIEGAGGGGAEIDDDNVNTTTTWSSDKIDSELIAVNGDIQDSVIKFIDKYGLFRYSGLYGSDTELEDGELYNITGTVIFSADGNEVYNGALEGVPYNDLAPGATQNNILGTAGYLWKDWVITYQPITGLYYEIPVKIAFIGQTSANGKYNPYIHIIYNYQCGHTIGFVCRATDYTKVPSSGGGGGLQEYAYTISSPDSTTISSAITSALVDAITNVGIDNLEKLRKIVAKTEYTFGTTPHVIEHVYDVKYTSISKGGGNFDDIDICAVGGENYYSAGDSIKTTKLIASRYNGILNTVEQSGTNPIVTSTDHSSTNVDNNLSPWYHNQSSPSGLAYKIVFVYG